MKWSADEAAEIKNGSHGKVGSKGNSEQHQSLSRAENEAISSSSTTILANGRVICESDCQWSETINSGYTFAIV